MLSMLYTVNGTLRFITPVFLLLLGAALHLYASYHRANALARIHAGQLTAMDAQRASLFIRWSAPSLTALGCVQLAFSCWHSLQ
ncbi:MAG: hypothetical protein HZA93_03755 [Verrucomicrobia bacterium]|nr:hypothetical protein [Verrucomicrobiota bacterium]